MIKAGDEKRGFPRIEIKENGIIYIYENDFECFVKDLSESGLAIVPDYIVPDLHINQIYEIGLINQYEEKPIYLKAMCIRKQKNIYGFRILYSTQEERESVINLLQIKIAEKYRGINFNER